MRHKVVEESFLGLIEETLPEEFRKKVEAHLGECEKCRDSLAQYKKLLQLERFVSEEVRTVGPEFRVQVMEALESESLRRRELFSRILEKAKKGFPIPLAVAATACIALFLAQRELVTSPEIIRKSVVSSGVQVPVEKKERDEREKSKDLLKNKTESDVHQSPDAVTEKEATLPVAPVIPPGHRAITVDLGATAGAEGFSKPGTRADVMYSYTDRDKNQKITTIVRSAKVLSAGSEGKNTEQKKEDSSKVTLLVNERDAQRLQLAEASGKLSLSLVGDEEGQRQAAQATAGLSADNPSIGGMDMLTGFAPSAEQRQPSDGVLVLKDRDGAGSKSYRLEGKKWIAESTDEKNSPPANELTAGYGGEGGAIVEPSPHDYYRRSFPIPPVPSVPSEQEVYGHYDENPQELVTSQPLSTFSIDVDTGSFANARRFLSMGKLPPADSVRVEEFVNAFTYNYPSQHEKPFAVNSEIAPSPFSPGKYLLKLGVKAKEVVRNEDSGWNLVFLIDTSGSMMADNKLGLLKRSLEILVKEMRATDRVSIVTFANNAQVILSSTRGSEKERILSVIRGLSANGGTNGGAGLDLAYDIASQNRTNEGVNRVIIVTDGDFNVGTYQFDHLMQMIETKRRSGITLTTIGVGEGNYNEKNLEQLANRGNGNYFYFDSFDEARKVFVEQLTQTMETVAKDVKLQIEFNPKVVKAYRLLGYDNRKLQARDFKNDAIDAGEVGSGHTVTALYEIVLVGEKLPNESFDEGLRYQKKVQEEQPAENELREPIAEDINEVAFVKIRFKEPNKEHSEQLEFPIQADQIKRDLQNSTVDFRFAAGVVYAAQILRGSKHASSYTLKDVLPVLRSGKGEDADGLRQEFIRLIENAQVMSR